jgi:hypothetical protein
MRSFVQTFIAGVAGALTVVVLIGATGSRVNQVVPVNSTGLSFSDAGITFPDGTLQTTAATVAPADSRRGFYLTDSTHDGAQALDACAPGFHMASIYEIFDPSNLRYATDAEATKDGVVDIERNEDSGVGPPSSRVGWVRTGNVSSGTASEGSGNCKAWTSLSEVDRGTAIALEPLWAAPTGTGTPSQIVTPWDSALNNCNSPGRVWCVEDGDSVF